MGNNFFLPAGYAARAEPAYFDDAPFDRSEIIHQPEVYVLADYLSGVMGRGTIVDLGCGSGRKLARTGADRRIGIDFGGNLAFLRGRYPAIDAREADLESRDPLPLSDIEPAGTVIVCADAIEHLRDPRPLLAALGALYERGAVILLSTPDRERVYGAPQLGPPRNPAHTREWTLAELVAFVTAEIAAPVFAGRTISDTQDRAKNTSLCVLDRAVRTALDVAREPERRPLAIVGTYNDRDIAHKLMLARLAEGLDLYVLDNRSTDGTDQIVGALAAAHPERIAWESLAADASLGTFHWSGMLQRKAEIAARHPGRWVLHIDSDEVLRSPWRGVTLARALNAARFTGADKVDFAVLNFTPTVDGFGEADDPLTFFSHFAFGTDTAHFRQRRAWIQGNAVADLAAHGGHDPGVPGARMFPYRFVNQHYPVRSQEHGLRKILHERLPRYARSELLIGWHTHYQHVAASDVFVQPAETLEPWFDRDCQEDYLVEIVSDAVLRRKHGSLSP